MTTKEFLRQYEYANSRCRRLEEEYEAERELLDAVRSSANIDGMPHQPGTAKTVEDRAIRLADKAAQLQIAKLDAIKLRQRVFNIIINVNGVKGDILYHRYIDLMQWEEICVAVKYSWKQTHRLHAEALADAELLIRSEWIFGVDEEDGE